MIEIRLDNELVGYYDELREALLQAIDYLTADGSATLDKNYKNIEIGRIKTLSKKFKI